MTSRILLYLVMFMIVTLAGCGYDNYEDPSSELSGQLVYKSNPIGVRSNEIELELWQHGYKLRQDIPVYVSQDGSFSAKLFDGEYQLVLKQGNGPWMNDTDSISVQLKGRAEVNVPVKPYYMINNESISYSNGSVEASFNVEQLNDSRDLEFVGLYIGTANIVDQIYNEASSTETGDQITIGGPIHLEVDLSGDLANRQYIFARIGLKITGKSELLFSQVNKIEL